MPESLPGLIFDPAQLERLSQLADVDTSAPVGDWACAAGTDLAATEVVITGWGSPRIDAQVLAGKRSLALESRYRAGRDVRSAGAGVAGTGNYGSVVGLIGAS